MAMTRIALMALTESPQLPIALVELVRPPTLTLAARTNVPMVMSCLVERPLGRGSVPPASASVLMRFALVQLVHLEMMLLVARPSVTRLELASSWLEDQRQACRSVRRTLKSMPQSTVMEPLAVPVRPCAASRSAQLVSRSREPQELEQNAVRISPSMRQLTAKDLLVRQVTQVLAANSRAPRAGS